MGARCAAARLVGWKTTIRFLSEWEGFELDDAGNIAYPIGRMAFTLEILPLLAVCAIAAAAAIAACRRRAKAKKKKTESAGAEEKL